MSRIEAAPLLEGRVAIVTGGASGIGRATCEALCAAGAAVVVADLNGEGAERVASTLRDEGRSAAGFAADMGEEDSITAMVAFAVDHFGGLDILHNNAADSDPALMARDLVVGEMDAEVWDRTMRVNLRGPMLGCKHAIPPMLKRGGGAIVNTSSASGLTGDFARSAYAASKAGLRSLTESVAAQYGKQGIRANAIAPSAASNGLLAWLETTPGGVEGFAAKQPMGKLGTPDEIANVAAFLASDYASFVNGVVLPVDGGVEAMLAVPA